MDVYERGEHRIRYLDGLRAVAVLLVVGHHAMLHAPSLPHPVPFMGWPHVLLEGAHGVDLFFVLSGFCLSYPVLHALRTQGEASLHLFRYFAKRIVRIVPPYYAAILLFAVCLPSSRAPVDILKQVLFLDWRTHFVNGSFWTLCVEFRWYFLFPVALALWIRAPRLFGALAVFSVIAYGMTRLHVPDVGTLLPFLLGIVAADMELRAVRIDPVLWTLLPICVLLALVLEQSAGMPSPFGAESSLFFVQTNPGWQIAAFIFVLAAARNRHLRALLSCKPLAIIGTASYSIYLVHEPVIAVVQSRLSLPAPVCMVLACSVAVVTGFVFWALFERVWTAGPLRQAALARLQPALARAGAALEIPAEIRFDVPSAARQHIG